MAVCTVTGVLRDPAGIVMPETTITIHADRITGSDDGAMLPVAQTTASDGSGAVAFDLLPGMYRMRWRTLDGQGYQATLGVPHEASANLADLLDAVSGYTPAIDVVAGNLAIERDARQIADAALRDDISAEISARASADALLGTRVDTEQQFRQSGDLALSNRIDGIAIGGTSGWSGPFPDVSAGISNTTDGEVFSVADSRGLRVFRNNHGVADELTALISADVASSAPYQPFASRAAAQVAVVPAPLVGLEVGGLRYIRDPSGTALQTADGARWSPADTVTPQHWGAVADGVVDDTAAMQAAVDWGQAKLRAVRCAEGAIRITSTINIGSPGAVLIGCGGAQAFKVTDGRAVSRIVFDGPSGDPALRIAGSSTGPTYAMACVVADLEVVGGHVEVGDYAPNTILEGVGVRRAPSGFIAKGKQTWSLEMNRCSTYEISGIPYDIQGSNQTSMYRCSANNNNIPNGRKPTSRAPACVRIGYNPLKESGGTNTVQAVSIRDCDFESAYCESVVWVVRGLSVLFEGNYIEARGDYETTLGFAAWPDQVIRIGDATLDPATEANTPTNVTISNNFLQCNSGDDATPGHYQSTDCVKVERCNSLVVESNHIRRAQTECVIGAAAGPIRWSRNVVVQPADVVAAVRFSGPTAALTVIDPDGGTAAGADRITVDGYAPQWQHFGRSGQMVGRFANDSTPQRLFRIKSRSSDPAVRAAVQAGDVAAENRIYIDTGSALVDIIRESYEVLNAPTANNATSAWKVSLRNSGDSMVARLILNSGGALYPGADNSQNFGRSTDRWAAIYSRILRPGSGAPIWTSGTGTPEGAVTAAVGSLYTREDGASGATLYVKETGSGNTGWVAK